MLNRPSGEQGNDAVEVSLNPIQVIPTEAQLKAIIAALDFDRGAIRISKEQLAPALEKAKKVLAEIKDKAALADYARTLAKQLGIYFAYHQRTPDLAITYLDIYANLAKSGSLDEVRANMYIGYAGTIRAGYNDTKLFLYALQDLDKYEAANKATITPQEQLEINVDRGYIHCFLGLVIHRKSYQTPGITEVHRIEMLNEAIVQLKKGQKAQEEALAAAKGEEELKDLYTQILIELPNTYHIESICHAKIPNRLAEMEALKKAIALEQQYVVLTGKTHFLLYVSQQNYALTTGLHLGDADNALKLIQSVLKGQQELFQDPNNLDIAKTYHFMAQIYAKLGMHKEAIETFLKAFEMKKNCNVDLQAFDMLETQTLMLNAVSSLRASDEDSLTHIVLMLTAVDTVLKFDWNNYKTFDGFKKLMPALIPVVDYLRNYLPGHTTLTNLLVPKLYELGAYHNHLKRIQPVKAFEYLKPALAICDAHPESVNNALYAWILNHMAFTYHQELAQSWGKEDFYLHSRFKRYGGKELIITSDNIRKFFYDKSMEAAQAALQFSSADAVEQNRVHAFAHLISSYNNYETQRYKTDKAEQIADMKFVVAECRDAVEGYKTHNDYQEQMLRASNRLADLSSHLIAMLDPVADSELIATLPVPREIHAFIKAKREELGTNPGNPYAGRFYFSEASYLAKKEFKESVLTEANILVLQQAIASYGKAYEILAASPFEGPKDGFTQDALKAKLHMQIKLVEMIDRLMLDNSNASLIEKLPARKAIIENMKSNSERLAKHEDKQEFVAKIEALTPEITPARTLATGSTTQQAGLFSGSAAEAAAKASADVVAQQQQTQVKSMQMGGASQG